MCVCAVCITCVCIYYEMSNMCVCAVCIPSVCISCVCNVHLLCAKRWLVCVAGDEYVRVCSVHLLRQFFLPTRLQPVLMQMCMHLVI